jgi:glycosyltransferase involved in cell wall biosynthesis
MNKFKIIVPFYNAERFLTQCQESLLAQNYKLWEAYLADDCSTDNSKNQIISDERINYHKNQIRVTALKNIHDTIMSCNPEDEDIICILDGDDFLFRNNSLQIIDEIYNEDTLLTYGQYIWPNGAIGHCQPYNENSFKNLRTGGYWASHMRTFKFKLYKQLLVQDPNLECYKDDAGDFFTTCYDVAIMTPLMEMAGLENIRFNSQPIYYYRIHDRNDAILDGPKQKSVERLINSKKPFKKVF